MLLYLCNMNFNFVGKPMVSPTTPSFICLNPCVGILPYEPSLFRELNLWKYESLGEILPFTFIDNIIYR